ncbi:MAG: hypothetical protein ABR543_03505 [Gemmatimonadaceae bacterium]
MRLSLVACLSAVCISSATAQRDSVPEERTLPRDLADSLVKLYNAPAALRASGSLNIPAQQRVSGNVAVLGGPLVLAGQVAGSVVVINGDVELVRGSRIEGDLVVVGGIIEGREQGDIGGEVRLYRPVLRYHEEGERIVADREREVDYAAGMRRLLFGRRKSTSSIALHTRGAYNRVEGLAIQAGPSFRFSTGLLRTRAEIDVHGIIRSADNFKWENENLGHDVRAELRSDGRGGIAIGGRLFDVVGAVETWQLRDTEIGLASFFLHRDYRDYFDRHGSTGYVSLFGWSGLDLTLSYSSQKWRSRSDRDPFTLFRNSDEWRPNPPMEEGRFRIGTAALTLDTRNDELDPWTGWLIAADVEHGRSSAAFDETGSGPNPLRYTRGFLDLRRYNRVSPKGQLNMRLVLGGWLGGDNLPLQRRFSVGGAGTLPGFRFRGGPSNTVDGTDVFTCAGPVPGATRQPGNPALCERLALAQLEYRGDLRISLGGTGDDDYDQQGERDFRFGFDKSGAWVVFADAGRGWLVGPRLSDLQYSSKALPGLHTFKTDLGIGLDFDVFGAFVAKSVSDTNEPARFLLRLRHRF